MSRADRSFAQALERIEKAGYLVNVRRCGGAVELCAVPLRGPAKLHIAFAEPRGPEDGYSAACRLAELLNVSLESPVTVAPRKRTGPKDASVLLLLHGVPTSSRRLHSARVFFHWKQPETDIWAHLLIPNELIRIHGWMSSIF